jgi:hypothetical protein
MKKTVKLNRSIISHKVKSVIKIFPPNKIPASNGFNCKFYQTLKQYQFSLNYLKKKTNTLYEATLL